ncbi:MAG: electron transfer flavoprotein subunit alpha/FixB family protein [Proteobacteria bacterium]|nr:electron transfer flavoprotein subunit alpha/FixB family protein [Pseudomonadota bacterium]
MSTYLIAEHKDGQLKKASLEMLSECLRQGTQPTCILLGHGALEAAAGELGKAGASKVVILEHAELASYSSEGFANALYGYLSKQSPSVIMAGASWQGKDYLPRLSAKFNAGLASDCTEFKLSGNSATVRRPVFAGKCSQAVSFSSGPAIFSVRPNVLAVGGDQSTTPQIEKVAADVGQIRAKVTEVLSSGQKKVDLTEADIIVSGGRSLKSADNFKLLFDCASVVGAAVGASRAAVDAGYAPHDMQVGQTGKTVSPKLYVACGISGAIQHLAGMRTSKVIVAINKDPEAPIFQKADYGIVGDLFEVVPHLTEELKKLKANS